MFFLTQINFQDNKCFKSFTQLIAIMFVIKITIMFIIITNSIVLFVMTMFSIYLFYFESVCIIKKFFDGPNLTLHDASDKKNR